ncbi:porin family protein [bacterium]|nr:porin family protein [bacterium]MCI0606876.1 porin family protein [bacterium]
MRFTIAAFAVLVLFAGFGFAQAPDYKTEVFGLAGIAGIHDDESYLGTGINFGGGLGLRLSRRFGFNIEGYYADSTRNFSSGVHIESNATTLAVDFHVYFPTGKVEPYVLVGTGLTRFNQTGSFIDPEFRSTDTGYTLQWGGGARIFLAPHVSIRPEFKWVSSSNISFVNQLRGTVSVGYHW